MIRLRNCSYFPRALQIAIAIGCWGVLSGQSWWSGRSASGLSAGEALSFWVWHLRSAISGVERAFLFKICICLLRSLHVRWPLWHGGVMMVMVAFLFTIPSWYCFFLSWGFQGWRSYASEFGTSKVIRVEEMSGCADKNATINIFTLWSQKSISNSQITFFKNTRLMYKLYMNSRWAKASPYAAIIPEKTLTQTASQIRLFRWRQSALLHPFQ